MPDDDSVILGHGMLNGLLDAERLLGWRPWVVTGLPSFFKSHKLCSVGDGTGFTELLTPINKADFKQWCISFIQKGDGEELAEVLVIAAYRYDHDLLPFIKQRFEFGPPMVSLAVSACLFYFIMLHEDIDRDRLTASFDTEAYHKDNTYIEKNACRKLFYKYWEMFPKSISDEYLYRALSKETDERYLRDHVALIGRLIRNGYDLVEKMVEIAGWPEIGRLLPLEIARMVMTLQDRALVKTFLSEKHNAKYHFVTALLKTGGYEFMRDIIEAYISNEPNKEELVYLLPFLAAIVPEDGEWVEPYESSSSRYARRGAAYALAFYPNRKDELNKLIKDKDDDVIAAAEFSEAVHDYGMAGAGNANWALAIGRCLFPRRPCPIDLIDAICCAKGLSETIALRHWRLLNSHAKIHDLSLFYSKNPGQLVETILSYADSNMGYLENGIENDHDILGRSILLLCIHDPASARVLLDQLMQDCGQQEAAKWLNFLLDAVGGSITPLAKLKSRILNNLDKPEELSMSEEELRLFPLLMEDDFCLESLVHGNAEMICAMYPHAIGKWIRSDVAPEFRAMLASAITESKSDPYLDGIVKLVHADGGGEPIALPERYFQLSLGPMNTQKRFMIKGVTNSDEVQDRKIEKLLSLSRGPSLDVKCADEFLRGMLLNIPETGDLISFLLSYIKGDESSPKACAAIQLLAERDDVAILPTLIDEWQDEKRGDVLCALQEAVLKLIPSSEPPLSLLSIGSAAYIGQRYNIDYDDILEYFPNKEESLALLVYGLMQRADFAYLQPGDYVTIHRWVNTGQANRYSFLTLEEFEKVVLRLSVVFENTEAGIVLCRIGMRQSDDILRLLFQENVGTEFWAYLGCE
jgi:hypothetical protein